ncbi:MAG: HutD family protein [Rubrivivax sp.]|nr:HutD family protein [Rubrivivax sp.]
MTLRLVRLVDCPAQPWRNGGGVTRELLRWPAPMPGTPPGAEDWLLRISVAEIASDGPFSAFPGVERWFAVLQGAGVRLALPDGERLLDRTSEPVNFAGAAAPMCTLLGGPTQDLNLMHRPGTTTPARALMTQMRRAPAGSVQRGRLPWRGLYVHGAACIRADEETHELPAGSLAWSDDAQTERWEILDLDADADAAYWMSLQP